MAASLYTNRQYDPAMFALGMPNEQSSIGSAFANAFLGADQYLQTTKEREQKDKLFDSTMKTQGLTQDKMTQDMDFAKQLFPAQKETAENQASLIGTQAKSYANDLNNVLALQDSRAIYGQIGKDAWNKLIKDNPEPFTYTHADGSTIMVTPAHLKQVQDEFENQKLKQDLTTAQIGAQNASAAHSYAGANLANTQANSILNGTGKNGTGGVQKSSTLNVDGQRMVTSASSLLNSVDDLTKIEDTPTALGRYFAATEKDPNKQSLWDIIKTGGARDENIEYLNSISNIASSITPFYKAGDGANALRNNIQQELINAGRVSPEALKDKLGSYYLDAASKLEDEISMYPNLDANAKKNIQNDILNLKQASALLKQQAKANVTNGKENNQTPKGTVVYDSSTKQTPSVAFKSGVY